MPPAVYPNPANIFYAGEIDECFLNALWQATEKLTLQSQGGCARTMCAALDILEEKELFILGTGMIMSAAVPILAAGQVRACTSRTRFLIHPVRSFGFQDHTVKDSLQEAEELKILEDTYVEALASYSRKGEKFWRKKLEGEFYFSADEAKQLGLIDEVQ